MLNIRIQWLRITSISPIVLVEYESEQPWYHSHLQVLTQLSSTRLSGAIMPISIFGNRTFAGNCVNFIEVQVMGWKCDAFTGCMGQPSTFKDFNKSYSRYILHSLIVYTLHWLLGLCPAHCLLARKWLSLYCTRLLIGSVRCPETRESVSWEFFLYTNIGKSIRACSCVRYNVWVCYLERPLRESWLYYYPAGMALKSSNLHFMYAVCLWETILVVKMTHLYNFASLWFCESQSEPYL